MQLQQQQELIEQEEDESSFNATPVCGGNFYTPVTDTTMYLDEMTWTIGGRKYIANAD